MNGLSSINVELTSRCNKSCFMCGRRKMETDNPDLCDWGDMPVKMMEDIARQVPPGVVVQLHNNGEPLLYKRLAYAVSCFKTYTAFNTNGKLLYERRREILTGNLDSLAVSIIPDDPEGDEQISVLERFLRFKQNDKPNRVKPIVVFRLLGGIDERRVNKLRSMAADFNCVMATRVLHAPDMSRDYDKPVTVPELGICLEMLHKLSIDRFGDVYPCVRYDPEKKNLIGNVNETSLSDIWESKQRVDWILKHLKGNRAGVPLCAECDYWGIPRGE